MLLVEFIHSFHSQGLTRDLFTRPLQSTSGKGREDLKYRGLPLKGPITLEPPYNFSEPYQSSIVMAEWHTHPSCYWRRLPSGEAPLSLYNAGRLRVPTVRESRLDHCWGNFGAGFSEVSAWALWAQVLWEDTRGQDLWHLPRPWKSPTGRLTLWDSGKLGLGQRSRVTERSPMGRLTLWDQREAGTWVHRSRKEARSGTTEGVQREGLRCGINGKLGLGCTDLGRTVLWEDTGRVTYRWFVER